MINVRVSATSANIGAGFDCMGLALNLFNEIDVSLSERLIIKTGGGFAQDETNLVYASMNEVFKLCGESNKRVKIIQRDHIPSASGLGSSAACVVAGVVAANKLLNNPLSEQDVVNLCTKLDGHPDNVVPAIVGGIAAGVMDNGYVHYIKCNAPRKLVLHAATPSFPLHTEKSRQALPNEYSRADVVYSMSRAIATFAALVNKDIDMLKIIDDKIHQPYRIPLISGYYDVVSQFEKAGCIAHFISGAGPTLIGIFKDTRDVPLPDGWTLRHLNIINRGVKVSER